jgi:hypothetical protein
VHASLPAVMWVVMVWSWAAAGRFGSGSGARARRRSRSDGLKPSARREDGQPVVTRAFGETRVVSHQCVQAPGAQ